MILMTLTPCEVAGRKPKFYSRPLAKDSDCDNLISALRCDQPHTHPKSWDGNNGGDHPISAHEASCANRLQKEVGADFLLRNSSLSLNLENANQGNAALNPARDGALIDGAFARQVRVPEALFSEQDGKLFRHAG